MFGNVGKKNKDLMDGNRELDFTVEGQPLLREKGWGRKIFLRNWRDLSFLNKWVGAKCQGPCGWVGDKNTKIFHQVVNSNWRNKSVDSLVINGSISSDFTEVREHIVQFYKVYS